MSVGELIEMTETVVDVHGFELRPGDQVTLLTNEGDVPGTVFHITRPTGQIIQTMAGATTEQPPRVTVLLDNGDHAIFEPEFMRLNMWRWNVLVLKRE